MLFLLLVVVLYLPFEYAWQWPFSRKPSSGSGGAGGWRRTKGALVSVPVAITFFLAPILVVLSVLLDLVPHESFYVGEVRTEFRVLGQPDPQPNLVNSLLFYGVVFGPVPLGAWLYYGWLKWRGLERVGILTGGMRRWWRRRGFGAGGSAGFGGLFEELSARFRRGDVLLGSSLYFSPKRREAFKIGMGDDRHMLTIAGSRGGKGRSAIIPNLILWPHSALVIDPKGTNAAVTALRRGTGGGRVTSSLGQDVFVVDPFGIVEGVERSGFNPLAAIDIDSLTVTEDIALLTDALVMPETGGNAEHFVSGARTIIAGVVAHLLLQEYETTPTLLDVRRALTGSAEELDEMFGAMAATTGVGAPSLGRVAASLCENAGPNERGSFFTTLTGNMKWLDSAAMAQILGRTDFDLADLKKGNMTVYVVLPPDLLEEHKRFMRLFVNLSIRAMSRPPRAENPVLFVLDEFFALGTMSLLEKAAGLLGGYNVKLWPIVQNLGQIKELYPQNWETFFSNAGAAQVFAVNDLMTEEYLVRMLGKTVRDIDVGERLQRVVAQLRETEELEEELAREAGREIVFRSGAPPLLLRRTNYDSTFPRSQYSPDPDHPGS